MNQNFASNLTLQLEQQKIELTKYQQELENLQQSIRLSQNSLGSELESYTRSVSSIIEKSMSNLEELEVRINELAEISLPNLHEIWQMLMSLQEVGNSKAEIERIKQQLLSYPSEIGQQIKQTQQIIQQQLAQHQTQISDQLVSLKNNLKIRYTVIVTMVLFPILLCCTFYAGKTLHARTLYLGQLNTIIGERQSELEKYHFAIQQAQSQLSRSNPNRR